MNAVVLADIGSATNAAIGLWVIIFFCVITGLGSLVTVVSVFATKRELDKLDSRVSKLEDESLGMVKALHELGTSIRAEIQAQRNDLVYSADRRSSVLHNRINPVTTNLSEMKGMMEAFTQSFDNFTEVMKSLGRESQNRK